MRFLILLVLLISFNQLNAQDDKGYYNSKFFVSIDGLVNNPFFYNIKYDSYSYSLFDKNLEQKKDKINYGFKLDLGVIMKRNFAFSVELGQEFSNIYTPKEINVKENNSNYSSFYSFYVDQSKLNVQTFTFTPKIHFATKNALLPLGLNHQIGVAINYSKLIKKDYAFNFDYNSSDYYGSIMNLDTIKNHYATKFFDYENQSSTQTFSLLYALSMRTPLTKKILLNYGFRYTLRINFSEGNVTYYTLNDYVYSQQIISNLIRVQRTRNIINFNLGLTYVF